MEKKSRLLGKEIMPNIILNPGMKFDGEKVRFDLIPAEPEYQLARLYTYGAQKYEDNSWQKVDNGQERYYAAMRRHINWWRRGVDIDEDFGMHHMVHAAWCSIAILWFLEQEGKLPEGIPFAGVREKFAAQREVVDLAETTKRMLDLSEKGEIIVPEDIAKRMK